MLIFAIPVAILRTPSPATSVSNILIDFFPSGTVSFEISVAVNFLRISAPAQITEGGYIQRRRTLEGNGGSDRD